MNGTPIPFDLPKRQSLSTQAAAVMRKSITDGLWQDYLPSERRLCELFHISRPTIRAAIHLLAKERLIAVRQGCRNRVLAKSRRPAADRNHLVLIITAEPAAHMTVSTSQSISEMKLHLAEQGFTSEIMVCPSQAAGAQRRKLDAFIRQNRVFCCVLVSVSRELQQWFSAQSIPALVLGSCHPGVKLPSLDVDHRAVCRHATGLLLGKGHRNIALVVPHSGVAGYLVSEKGFNEAIEQHNHRDRIKSTIVRHNGTAQSITAKLDALFYSKHVPTALLVAKPLHVFIVIIYLLKRGLTVPGAVSFIARDFDHVFESVSPIISHYYLPNDTFARRCSQMMVRLINHGTLATEPVLISPKYVAGETVRDLTR